MVWTIALIALFSAAWACTDILITPGASADGSAILTYNADAAGLVGNIPFFERHRRWPDGTMINVTNWDTGVFLGTIPQVAETYNVVGNMNEYQLAIVESTFSGLRSLWFPTNGTLDYGSLIYITLQRSKTAREAISTMTSLIAQYGYASTGESFSLADPHEVWYMELIGKGNFEKGAVWVALKVPDGYVSAHANQARITTFPLNDTENCVYSPDVISFAKAHGLYPLTSADDQFSFSDTYNPVSFYKARYSETRVWNIFRHLAGSEFVEPYVDYVLGRNLTHRMPLWVLPSHKVTLNETMWLMRDHYEGTQFAFSSDVGAGPYGLPYRWPQMFTYNGKNYLHEREIGIQRTAFGVVTQSRAWLPRQVGGLMWFASDDITCSVYFPMYSASPRVPSAYMTAEVDKPAQWDTAFWAFSAVANWAYSRWSHIYPDIAAKINQVSAQYSAEVADLDQRAQEVARVSPLLAQEMVASYSVSTGQGLARTWFAFFAELFARYQDGVKMTPSQIAGHPKITSGTYPNAWLARIVQEDGDRYLMRT